MKENIFDLITAYKNLEYISPEQQEILDKWLQDPVNREFWERIDLIEQSSESIRHQDSPVRGEPVLQAMWQRIIQRSRRRRIFRRTAQIAAACLILLSISTALYYLYQPQTSNYNKFAGIVPGSTQAILELAEGSHIILDGTKESILLPDSLKGISILDGTLVYSPDANATITGSNTLTIPRGGEYTTILSDGTKIMLNSDTKLQFPVAFNENERRVILIGEAYFEVTANPEYPFIIETELMDIRVTGTSFNINTYPERSEVSATLESGTIEIEMESRTWAVKPGQRAVVQKDGRNIQIETVDTELYTSWRNGYYKFRGRTLEEIFSTLAVWYDMEVLFENESAKEIEFTGLLRRFDDIEDLLKKFGHTGDAKFEIKEKQIIIK